MAKGVYIGVNNVARKVKKSYIGVGNVARKIKKAYIGVNGVARECYPDALWLYNNGDEFTSTTGGFVSRGMGVSSSGLHANNPSVSRSDTSITVEGNGGILVTSNFIDLTPYKILKFSGTVANSDIGYDIWHSVVALRLGVNYYTDGPLAYGLVSGTTYTDLEIDISNINESCQIGVGVYSGPSTSKIQLSSLCLV